MIYLFFGEDNFRSRERLHGFLEGLKEKSLSSFFWFNPETFTKPAFEELARTKDLFGGNYIIVCENLLGEKEIADFCLENLGLCSDSGNNFIFWEEDMDSSAVKIFKKYAKNAEEFKFLPLRELKIWLDKEAEKRKIALPSFLKEDLIRHGSQNLWFVSQELEKYALSSKKDFETIKKAQEMNIFHLTDAVGEKDKSRAWLLFQKMMTAGADPEEIFWKIVWQIRNLLLLKKLGSMPEKKITEATRLHPYVVKKAARASRNFSEEELAKYSSELIDLYHNSRRGLADFDIGIEKFLIKI